MLKTSSRARAIFVVLSLSLGLIACGPSAGADDDDGGDDDASCSAGSTRCDGLRFQTCTDGAFVETAACPLACSDTLGCTVCEPGTGTCNGEVSTTCRADGTGYYEDHCDPVQGSTCGEAGVCTGPCASTVLADSYIGCEYYATQTGNGVFSDFQFAISVSNTGDSEANVQVDGGALTAPLTFTVGSNAVSVQYLPWIPALKACMGTSAEAGEAENGCGLPQSSSAMAPGGGYRIRSDRPITAYQFNPLDYANATFTVASYSNDASLLLPVTAWGTEYVAASWPAWMGALPSQMAVTAAEDGTEVTFTNRADTDNMMAAGTPTVVALNRGDVIQLMSSQGDYTGSHIASNKPVQLIAGHYCTQVPEGYLACDHLEESIFPIATLSREYVISAPHLPAIARGREQVIRVIATEAGTTVTFDPPVLGPTVLANRGDVAQLTLRAEDFHISADKKVLVAQYMASQEAPPAAGTGNPAMTIGVPVEQYRTSYLFHAPAIYETSWVNVTAPAGTSLVLDGNPLVPGVFHPVGSSRFVAARLQLAPTGNHTLTADQPFGISVYGYGQYTSYWYPGGLDLAEIAIE